MSANDLYNKYKDQIIAIINAVKQDQEKATPFVIVQITTVIIPLMLADVRKMEGLTIDQRKQVIKDGITLAINELFTELNTLPQFAASQWDEVAQQIILQLIGPTIDLLLKVESGTTTSKPGCFSNLFKCKK